MSILWSMHCSLSSCNPGWRNALLTAAELQVLYEDSSPVLLSPQFHSVKLQ